MIVEVNQGNVNHLTVGAALWKLRKTLSPRNIVIGQYIMYILVFKYCERYSMPFPTLIDLSV